MDFNLLATRSRQLRNPAADPICGMPEATIKSFFILGCPRSGTTLLQAMLNREPRILIPPETKLFCSFHTQPTVQRRQALDRIQEVLELPHIIDDKLSTRQCLQQIQLAYLDKTQRSGIECIGEKTPEHTGRLRWIRQEFPDTPIFALVRDGRAVALSLANVPWLRADYLSGAIIWNHYMCRLTEAVNLGDQNLHIIRYEDLIADPMTVLASALAALGVLDGNIECCLTPCSTKDSQIFPARELPWKKNSTEPIDLSKMDYRSRGTQNQLDEIDCICHRQLVHWGYASKLTKPRRLLLRPLLVFRIFLSVSTTLAHLPKHAILNEFRYRYSNFFT